MGKVADSLQRMRELAVQSANSTNSASDKDSLDLEYQELGKEIQRVLGGTTFNGRAILGTPAGAGTGADVFKFQVGANTSTEDSIDVTTTDLTLNTDIVAVTTGTSNSIGSAVTVLKPVIDALDTAINTINTQRATMGAVQSRFDSVIGNLQISVENQSAARSRIMDTDFAQETANLSRAQILQQAGNAMVAQANQLPQQVMALLRG